MKKNNKGKAKSKTNANTVLPAVKLGGAVKLNWYTDPRSKDSIMEEHWTDNEEFKTEIIMLAHMNRYMYKLKRKDNFIGYFKKLASVKMVAQLIYEG